MGVGSNSLGGRRQALLGLTQHRHDFKKASADLGGNTSSGFLGGFWIFFGFTVELMNFFDLPGVGIGQVGCSAGSLGREEMRNA